MSAASFFASHLDFFMFGLTLAGLLVGFAVGATGVGGGALMTPILILVFGMTPSAAVGTDLLYAAITKGFGAWFHQQEGTVDWRVVFLLASGSVPATVVTIAALNWIGIDDRVEQVIVLTLCGAILLTAIMTLIRDQLRRFSDLEMMSTLKLIHRRWRDPMTVASGAVLGVVVSLSSVGAGVIGATLLLLLYPRWAAISVVGTDLAHAVPLTALAGLGHMTLGTTDLNVLLYLLLGSLPGIWLGTRLGLNLPDKVLRPIIVGLLLVIGAGLFIEAVAAPIMRQ